MIQTNLVKRVGLHFSSLALLAMPVVFALGWWARGVNYGHRVDRLEQAVAGLRIQQQNDRLIDELRGTWDEMSCYRGGQLTHEKDVDGTSPEVEWLLAPDGGSQRSILKAEMETLDLDRFAVDTTNDPTWIDFHSRGGGRPFVCLGIVRVSYGYTDFGTATIAMSPPSWEGDPQRPTNFESTHENGVWLFRLRRHGRYSGGPETP
jgi:hypothetical protein